MLLVDLTEHKFTSMIYDLKKNELKMDDII